MVFLGINIQNNAHNHRNLSGMILSMSIFYYRLCTITLGNCPRERRIVGRYQWRSSSFCSRHQKEYLHELLFKESVIGSLHVECFEVYNYLFQDWRLPFRGSYFRSWSWILPGFQCCPQNHNRRQVKNLKLFILSH